jgi:hypothetical protein
MTLEEWFSFAKKGTDSLDLFQLLTDRLNLEIGFELVELEDGCIEIKPAKVSEAAKLLLDSIAGEIEITSVDLENDTDALIPNVYIDLESYGKSHLGKSAMNRIRECPSLKDYYESYLSDDEPDYELFLADLLCSQDIKPVQEFLTTVNNSA